MGRWAQQRRRGSSPPGESAGAPLAVILSVQIDFPDVLVVTFSTNVTAAQFTPGLFELEGIPADGVAQSSASALSYNAAGWSASSGQNWSYSDLVAGILTPQTGQVN